MMNIIRAATPAVTDAVIATTKVFKLVVLALIEGIIVRLAVAMVCEATVAPAVALINLLVEDLCTECVHSITRIYIRQRRNR